MIGVFPKLSISSALKMNSRPGFWQTLLPEDCILCGVSDARSGLCADCHCALPRLPPEQCPVCTIPSRGGAVCGACLAAPPAFLGSHAALAYAFPVDALIQRFKYAGDLSLGAALGQLLLDALREAPRPDALVPMPLHPARLRERGFNQALELARQVGRRLAIPVLPAACRRLRDTSPQAALPWKEREKNIRGAFACEADLSGKRIAIVDDVMTTGHTLNELSRILRQSGAARVDCWVVARTLRDS